MQTDNIKISVYITTNKIGAETLEIIEIARDEWKSMSEEEQERYCLSIAMNNVEWSYWETLKDDEEY